MKKERRKNGSNILRKVIGTTAAAVFVLAAAFGTAVPAKAAGLLIADGGFGGVLEIVQHDVRVTINNGVAVTEVTQIFRNTENRQVEALYTFPVPKGASVSNFSMWINGTEMVGEVVEKKRAREIYDSYKQQRRDPGLLEQADYKTFEMRIFPIAAGAEQRVQVAYYQELDFDHDWATWVYPLATVTRTGLDNRVNGRFSCDIHVRSEVPITVMESPSHEREFEMIEYNENYYEASLESHDGDLARDLVVAYQVSRPITGFDLLTSRERGEDGHFMLTLTAGEELEKTQAGNDYVFILDVSGSMAQEGKLSTSRRSIESFVEVLTPEDRFEVITFSRQPMTLFGQLEPVSDDTTRRAVDYLMSREARGGTSLKPALGAAYKYADPDRALYTVILSDGMTEQDESRILAEMIRTRPANVIVFCIGVGNEINRPLLTQVAEGSGGLAAFISQGDDFGRQARAFYRKLTHPVATDLAVDIGGVKVYDLEPENLPNLYHGAPLRIYGRYRRDGAAQVTLTGTVNGRPVETVVEMDFPKTDTGNPEIERMWAWHRLQRMQKEHEQKGSSGALDEIIRLGEGYSIASEYTSFIVLENDGEYKRWKIERRNALRIQRDRVAQERTRKELEVLRTEAMNDLGPDNGRKEEKRVETAQAPRPAQQAQPSRPVTQQQDRRRNVNLPGFGGGAVDPLTGLAALALGGAALLGRRRRRRR